jgi:hypothetical protein
MRSGLLKKFLYGCAVCIVACICFLGIPACFICSSSLADRIGRYLHVDLSYTGGPVSAVLADDRGETEAQFEDTMILVREVRYDSAFTFIYSPRTGTKAAKMEGLVPEEVSSERIQRLIALQESLQQETLSRFIGQEEEILVEGLSRRSAKAVSGKGRHAVSVTVDGDERDIGQILKCRVTGLKNNTLTGERI